LKNGMRWTTGIGIVVGGVGGALAALMGAPKAPSVAPTPVPRAESAAAASSAPAVESAAAQPATPVDTTSAAPATPAPSASAATPAPSASAAAPTPPSAVAAAPALELPTTREGLLKAEMLCDQKKDFDECARAAEALEKGTTDTADPEQGKRFRKIALTHLVMQCESGSPHACFVLAAKYRAGTELTASTNSADTLEKRGLELCHKRSAPECPAP
jgi:hypothetical protein